MQKRSYRITFGLKEGYSKSGKLHTPAFASKIIKKWMTGRIDESEPIVSGLLQEGSLFFPSVNGSAVTVAKSMIFFGELSTKDDMHRADKEVKATLESLATFIKKSLNQQAVYIIYRDDNWYL